VADFDGVAFRDRRKTNIGRHTFVFRIGLSLSCLHVLQCKSLFEYVNICKIVRCVANVPWRLMFSPRADRLVFVVYKIATGRGLLRVLPFSPGSIPPVLHIHSESPPIKDGAWSR
jgi:hypothetical protein